MFGLDASASMMSVVNLVLYLNSETATALYHRPEWLWLIAPVLLYWISRVWLLAARGEMHDDPVVFAVAILGFAL
ncbi:hypothetical protein WDW86_12175 [Bdellovibrionota bacterium FG-2]